MINFAGSGGAAGGAFEGDKVREEQRLARAKLAAQVASDKANRAQKERQMNLQSELDAEKLMMQDEHATTAEGQAQQKIDLQAGEQAWSSVVDQQRMRESEMRVKQGQAEFERYNMLFQEEKAEKEKKKWLAQTGISSAMKLAAMNGGVVPESCIASLNHDFGIDGKDGNGFIGGGFQKDGTFVLDFKKMGADGKETIVPQALTPVQQMKAIQQTGIYDETHMDTLYKTLMRQGMRPEEIGLGYSNGGKGSAGVEIAKINAASRERVANMRESGLNRRFDKGDQTKRDLAELSAALRERGFDIQEDKLEELVRHNKSGEEIAGGRLREQERHNRAGEAQQAANEEGRNERANARRDVDWAKVDAAADKWKEEYQLRLKAAKTADERLAVQKAYNEGRIALQEGQLDVSWANAEERARNNQANNQMRQDSIDKRDKQKTEDREERRRQFDEREKRLAGTGNGGSTNGNKSRIEQMRRLDKQYETALKMGGISEEERQGYLDQIDAERKTLFEQSEADGEKAGLGTSDDGGTRKKVSYNDLKPGDTFTYKGRKCVKTEKGFKYLD